MVAEIYVIDRIAWAKYLRPEGPIIIVCFDNDLNHIASSALNIILICDGFAERQFKCLLGVSHAF